MSQQLSASPPVPKNASQVVLGSHYVSPSEHYKTTTARHFAPPNVTERVRPARDRQQLSATNYSLGEEKSSFLSRTHEQFRPPKEVETKELPHKEKPLPDRTHLITGERTDRKGNVFDFYDPNLNKRHRSADVAEVVPAGYRLHHTTGRLQALPTEQPSMSSQTSVQAPLRSLPALRPALP
eukprot:GILK01008922.1.p1 GENE.GILK01008922.1~~GILK01008922.1.p1  ORF type:complete len:194 (+),score=19.89 GILK01008922.1:40-582(+)